MMKIYIDFKSPSFHLAFRPTMALIEKYQIAVEWLPFRSVQKPVPQRLLEETKTQTHLRIRAEAREKTHLMYAEYQALPMKFPPIPGETDLALAALLHVKTDPGKYIKAALEACWIKNADLNDIEVVWNILSEAGVDPADCDLNADLAELEIIQKQAEEAGIVETPAYVIGNQVFIGREHFPWIESLIVEQKSAS